MRVTALPRHASNSPRIQNAWYNFDIPFTDYQFDPSLEGIKTAATVVKDKAVEAFDWIVDQIKDLVNSGIEWLKDKWNSIESFATSALDAATKSFTNIVGFFKNPLGFLTNALMSLDAQAIEKAWATFSGLISTVANGFKAMTDTLLTQVNKVWGGINSFATSLLGRVSGLTENFLFKKLPDALQNVAFTFVNKLKALWKSINDAWTKLFNKVKAWIDGAIDKVFGFVRKVLSFGINVLVSGIVQFGKIILFLKDLFANPMKYVELLAQRSVQAFEGVETRFAGVLGQYFGGGSAAKTQAPGTTTIHRAPAEIKRSASWGDIGHGIAVTMGKKWDEFKANPMAVVKQLLIDLIFPMVGNIKDVIELFTNIKKVVTGPLSAGSLDEFWTSLLLILDIPIMIYHTVVGILMRTLMVPLIVATFIPHPLVKAIAAAVGYALLGGFVRAEMMNLAHKLLLLKTGKTTEAQKEEAYNRIADSLIALAMTAVIMIVMLILHFIANLMKGVYNFVKGKVFGVEKPAPVEGKGESAKSKSSEVVEFEEASIDGKRKVRVREDGVCEVCASPCDTLRRKYADEIANKPEIEKRLSEIESSVDSKSNKARRYRQVEQDLADVRKAERLAQEPKRLRDVYSDELANPDNADIRARLDSAEKITDPAARQKALADVQQELSNAKHPTKQGAYHGPKPKYTNPGSHVPGDPNYRGGGSMTTTLPADAEAVYQSAIPDAAGKNWYGRNASGEVYRYQPNGGSEGGVHWNGRESSPRGLVVPPEVRARFRASE
ncbi:hypothetical protein [Variovorax sp. J22R115]|uniref:phage tail protein n=1 Tax=Variovorax sp. J22R115 TaxID=3053509 RepID=UPI0025754C63|nr:hypothetical protein [Variovorax sp. J22R115]MDM0047926.1 hypothetical protein [Variovorax sp. J22R115]